jgi:hypothetical protein
VRLFNAYITDKERFRIRAWIERFRFVGVLKQKLQGIDVRDDEELKSEILTILQGISLDELRKSFDRCVERGQWVPPNCLLRCKELRIVRIGYFSRWARF